MNIRILPVVLIGVLICACASNPDKIAAAYVSPLKYKDYDCDQIAMEMDYVGQRTNRLYQNLKKEEKADKWQMGVGLLLFWPTLFALEGGDGPEATEYAQLKGEFEALRTTSVQKKCGYEDRTFKETVAEAAEEPAGDEQAPAGMGLDTPDAAPPPDTSTKDTGEQQTQSQGGARTTLHVCQEPPQRYGQPEARLQTYECAQVNVVENLVPQVAAQRSYAYRLKGDIPGGTYYVSVFLVGMGETGIDVAIRLLHKSESSTTELAGQVISVTDKQGAFYNMSLEGGDLDARSGDLIILEIENLSESERVIFKYGSDNRSRVVTPW